MPTLFLVSWKKVFRVCLSNIHPAVVERVLATFEVCMFQRNLQG